MPHRLPDPKITLRESADFILTSRLGRKALHCHDLPHLAVFLRDLIEAIHRLVQSCHLPEFTDHGLPHLCSLVDRISQWTCAPNEVIALPLCELVDEEEAAILLMSTLFHDMGMLSQRPEDLPEKERARATWEPLHIPEMVRKTHVVRLPGLLSRLFRDDTHWGPLLANPDPAHPVGRALLIAQAHDKWPWETGYTCLADRDRGLAAVLAVADLLDEDASRCDIPMLLDHREPTLLNIGHWVRHGLTVNRLLVSEGIIQIEMACPPDAKEVLQPAFSALRNLFRLVGLYNGSLAHLKTGKISPSFDPEQGLPTQIAENLRGWHRLELLPTEQVLAFVLMSSFFDFALLRGISKTELELKGAESLEKIDLTLYDNWKFKQPAESSFDDDRIFYVILGASPEETEEGNPVHDLPGISSQSARGQKALEYLRRRAMAAHHQGNGKSINNLCSLALENAQKWSTEKTYLGSEAGHAFRISHYWWAIILKLYWLIDDPFFLQLDRLLESAPHWSAEDNDLLKILKVARRLVTDPLYLDPRTYEILHESGLNWVNESNKFESGILLQFTLEMLWRRGLLDMDNRWRELGELWVNRLDGQAPEADIVASLRRVINRLSAQSCIVWPGITAKDPAGCLTAGDGIEYDFFQTWDHWVNCQWESLESLISKLSPSLPTGSEYDLPGLRLHRLTRSFRNQPTAERNRAATMTQAESALDSNENERPQRDLAEEFPRVETELTSSAAESSRAAPDFSEQYRELRSESDFNDERNQRLRSTLAQLWSQGTDHNMASERFHCFRLAMSIQISALRSWDLYGWLKGAKQLSETYLEVARHQNSPGEFAMYGVWFALLSLSFREDDKWMKAAMQRLETSETKYLRPLVQALLNTRPIEFDHTMVMYAQLSDAIPEDLLESVAHKCVACIERPQSRLRWSIFPLGFWADVLPKIDRDRAAKICEILSTVVEKNGPLRAVWLDDSRRERAMLTEYLVRAPIELSVRLVDIMLGVTTVNAPEHEARWTLIYNAAIRRADLARRFRKELASSAVDERERYYLQYLEPVAEGRAGKRPPEEVDDTELRTWCIEAIQKDLGVIKTRSHEGPRGPVGRISVGLVGRVKWRAEDIRLVEELVSAARQKDRIFTVELVEIIQCISKIASNGPMSIAEHAKAIALEWLHAPPTGQTMFDWPTGPMSTLQATEAVSEDVLAAVAFFNAELVRRLDREFAISVGQWVIKHGFSCPPKAWRDVFVLAVKIGRDLENSIASSLIGTAQVIISRALEKAEERPEYVSFLVGVLKSIMMFMDPKAKDWNVYDGPNKLAKHLFIDALTGLMPRLRDYTNPEVRTLAAKILRQWKACGYFPQEMDSVLQQFKEDARARVRYEAVSLRNGSAE